MAKAKKLPSGSWRALVYSHTEVQDGEKKRIYESFTADTEAEANFAAAEFTFKQKGKKKEKIADMTVGEAFDRYIESKAGVLSPTTVRVYTLTKRSRLRGIMDVKLHDLTQEMVQAAVGIDASEVTPKTVRNAHGLLSAVLAQYHPSFVLRTALPQKRKIEMTIPEDEQIRHIMAETKGTHMELAIALAACLGLRRSEICALTWDDIDFINKRVRVNKAMVMDKDYQWVQKDPKTYAGFREIDMEDPLRDLLLSREPKEGRLVELVPDSITGNFKRLKDKHGFKFRFHDLRAYNASVMLALGIPDKYAMERMGHATPNMLKNVYQHTIKDKQTQFSEAMNEHFKTMMQHEMQHE